MDRRELENQASIFLYLSTRLPSNQEPHRCGGVLSVGIGDRVLEVKSFCIDKVSDLEKLNNYSRFSPEKLYRLQADYLRSPEIISSWWTRDRSIDRYGGAVLFPQGRDHCIISFSGLLEHVDEAISLMIGHKQGIADDNYVRRIIEKSKNPVYPEMLEMYRKQ